MNLRCLRDPVAWAVLLVAVTVYANSITNGFALDDTSIVGENPKIESLARLPEYFTTDYWEPSVRGGLYRPLVTTSIALNYVVGGYEPLGYHLANIAMHAVVSVLVLLLFRRITSDPWVSGAAALYFAAHAIHTEAVANIVGRGELLAALFILTSLLSYAAARESRGPGSNRHWAVSIGAYAAGLLCKGSAITLLGLLPLWDLCLGTRPSGFGSRLRHVVAPALVGRYACYGAVTVIYLVIRHHVIVDVQPTNPLDNPLLELGVIERIPAALVVAWKGVGLLLFPLHLSYDYSHSQIVLPQSLFEFRSLLASAGALGLLVVWVWSWRAFRALFFALGFALVTWSLVSNLLIPIGTILGERLFYLPSVGFCLALALVLRAGLARLAPPYLAQLAFAGLFVAIVGANAVRTILRNPDWESDRTILLAALDVAPGSAKVLHNAAAVQHPDGDVEEAVANYRRAIEIYPGYGHAHSNLGHILLSLGREKEAIEQYEAAQAVPWTDAKMANNLGLLLIEHEIDLKRGFSLVKAAQALKPDKASYKDSLGWAYYKLGHAGEALPWLREALAAADTDAEREIRQRHLNEVEHTLSEQEVLPMLDSARQYEGGSAGPVAAPL